MGRPSRAKQFFGGFFAATLFGLVGLAGWLLSFFSGMRGMGAPAALLVLVASAILVVRWWKRARWRSYGVVAGLVAAPPLLAMLVLLAMELLQINPMPH